MNGRDRTARGLAGAGRGLGLTVALALAILTVGAAISVIAVWLLA